MHAKKATTAKHAVRMLANLLFSEELLQTCSVKGFKTRKDQQRRAGLPGKSLEILNGECFIGI